MFKKLKHSTNLGHIFSHLVSSKEREDIMMSILRVNNRVGSILREVDDRRLIRTVSGSQSAWAAYDRESEVVLEPNNCLGNSALGRCFNLSEN